MAVNACASLSDWSGSDVRCRLHGGCRLATHLPDHCQLPSVPPTQTLALWITLHEHAQRREFGLWMCDIRPSFCIHHSLLLLFHFLECISRNNRVERSDVVNVYVDDHVENYVSQKTELDVMRCMLEVSQMEAEIYVSFKIKTYCKIINSRFKSIAQNKHNFKT